MAIHQDPWSLAEEAIEEYLLAARHCLDHRKSDGGCLGYPGALLLLCVVNALGAYLRHETVTIEGKVKPITQGEPFRVLNHSLFGLNLSDKEIKTIETRYRNMLAHDAMSASASWLLPGRGSTPFVFDQRQVAVYVETFYDLVANAWQQFDRTKIRIALEKKFVKVNR